MKKTSALIAALLTTTLVARADGLALGGHIGTLGPGLELAGYLTENLDVRLIGSFINANVHGQIDDIDYDADFKFTTVQAVLDLHAKNSGWRLTGGIVHNNNEIDVTGKPANSTISINGNDYPSAVIGQFSGSASFTEWAGYLGFGYGHPVGDNTGWSFSFDLGVMIQDSPQVTLTATGPIASDPAFQSDLKQEEKDAQDVADKLQYYPVVTLGLCYQFW